MAVKTFQKKSPEKLCEYFVASEFDCPCGACSRTIIDEELVAKLTKLRLSLGATHINSGYRCQRYQDELRLRGYETALGVSQHTLGKAADVQPYTETPGAEIEK